MQEHSEGYAVLLEELRVTEEELRAQSEQLAETQQITAQERERYHSLFDRAPIPYIVTDRQGVIREANHASSVMFRVRTDYLVGKPLSVFVSPSARAVFRQHLVRLASGEEPLSTLLRVQPREGGERLVSATAAPVFNRYTDLAELRWILAPGLASEAQAGQPRADPVREARSAQHRAEQAARTMADLIAWASHELRTPATSIGGYAEILALGVRGHLTADQQAILTRIQQSQAHLVALLDDLLTFAKAGSGHLRVDIASIAVAPILARLQALVEPQVTARDIVLTIACEPEVEVFADPERLLQILLNLVGNAVKFTPTSGRISVDCRVEGDSVRIAVLDNGVGIPSDALERIFEPYVQLGAPNERSAGSGLGLGISRELARLMGGNLVCENDPQANHSVFVLSLPRSTGIAPTPDRP